MFLKIACCTYKVSKQHGVQFVSTAYFYWKDGTHDATYIFGNNANITITIKCNNNINIFYMYSMKNVSNWAGHLRKIET